MISAAEDPTALLTHATLGAHAHMARMWDAEDDGLACIRTGPRAHGRAWRRCVCGVPVLCVRMQEVMSVSKSANMLERVGVYQGRAGTPADVRECKGTQVGGSRGAPEGKSEGGPLIICEHVRMCANTRV